MAEQLTVRQIAYIDSFLASAPSKVEIHKRLPSMREDLQGPYDAVAQAVHHLVPGPGGVVPENGEAATEQFLQDDHLDTEAVRTLLDLEIPDKAIKVKHYRWTMQSLRENLLLATPDKIPRRQAYARVLNRLARRITALHSVSTLSSRPVDFIECLDRLLSNMEKGFVLMKQTGNEDDVFILTDHVPIGYSERLSSLASELIGDQL